MSSATSNQITTEVKIVTVVEGIAGILYVLNLIAFPFMYLTMTVTAIMAFFSFLIAYGLWKIKKWAWLLSISLSILGLVSGILVLLALAASNSALLWTAPALIIDLMVILTLLTKGVRPTFFK